LLDSGCVCCQIRGELKQAILDLLTKRHLKEIPQFERIVIETTGLSDPLQIYSTLIMDPVLRNKISLNNVTTIVDCLNSMSLHSKQPEWAAQVAAANLIILSKTDLVTKNQQLEVEKWVSELNPIAQIAIAGEKLDWTDRKKNLNHLINIASSDYNAHGGATTIALKIDFQVDWTAFVVWLSALIHRYGDKILRVKCLLNTIENGALLIDGVGHTLHQPQHLEAWPDSDPRSRIVFIARGLDLRLVEASFRVFVERLAGSEIGNLE
ncbi:MAG: GTP-binding protein, partial [Rhizobiales bacterium]|nr:GTP-binding protein [Hyphomicrobiales bacterium]